MQDARDPNASLGETTAAGTPDGLTLSWIELWEYDLRIAAYATAVALIATPALADDHKSILLVADHIFDAKTGALIDHQAILEVDGKIESVAPVKGIHVPANTRRIDFPAGATLLPGLIDAHTHLLNSYDIRKGFDDPNMILTVTQLSLADRALLGAKNAREDLLAGITTVRDLGNSGVNGDVALKSAIDKGWVQGSRMVVSTRALAPIGGQFGRLVPEAKSLIDQEYVVVTGAEQARAAVRQARFDGADLIKVIVDNAVTVLDVDEMTAIVDEAHRVKMKVAAHAVSDLAIGTAITAGVDSIEHGYRASDASLERMAKQHIYLTPTDSPLGGLVDIDRALPRPSAVRITESAQKRLRKAVELGVPIVFGSDNYYGVPGATWGQVSLETLVAYVQTGMTPVQVLQAATINPATLLGLDKKIGSLEPGKIADIVAVPGNPLSDPLLLQRISFVMKAGEVVRDDATPASH